MKKFLLVLAASLLPFVVFANLSSLATLQKSIERNKSNQDLKIKFAGIATGVDLTALESRKKETKQDLTDELKSLATPLIKSIKRVSERPRRIEVLKEKIALYEQLLLDIETAQEKISSLLHQKGYSKYGKVLRSSSDLLNTKYEDLLLQLDLANGELSKIIGEKRSLIETLRGFFGTFLKTKGKNLLIATLSFLAVALFLSFLKRRIFKLSIFYHKLDFLRKPLSAFYSAITSILALIASIICLYALNDWLLVTIIIFVIMGLGWSLKNYIPQFFEEIKLILNFGAVREGEKIYFDGIPWRVDKLSFYCRLSNDSLQGGRIRVPAKKILGCHSRKISKEEKWFPTERGDWILLDGTSLGLIELQSPDQVIINKMGGGTLYISCSSLLAMNIENLSEGYSITGSYGLDYSLQRDLSGNLFNELKDKFVSSLKDLPGVESVSVEFRDCGSDSLNLFVRLDCSGEVASKYFSYQRVVQKTFLDLCNEKNFDIPFRQLTVHMNQNG